ncbi:MAG: Kef family K(+) transporter [Candidatus Tokpelaia sp.]|nr:MAG: Kef family K(+) transporter [Candidatus Tokpelaia sp.]KAA6207138.1 MAG: Kef family K(+) transporter [Candidatus Tokpelaia sp.]
MAHDAPLITAIVIGLCLAFIFGAIANRLRISPLVGYVLAGVLVGPNTPGFQADSNLVQQLAEIGVILLMFGVGLHFSLKDLLSVRHIAIPGAIIQMACSTCLGLLFALSQGWGTVGGLVFGLALATASTVVLLRALQEKSLLESERGRIAVGWLIVEDMIMVLLLVLLPVLAGRGSAQADASNHLATWLHFGNSFGTGGLVLAILAKFTVFIAVMMLVGRRLIPKILKMAAQTGSRELFSLSVLAIALGVAFGSAQLFGVSLALGAFFAGMIMSESDLSQRAAEETLPLRDAFAVLFFVSVGMLFQPGKIVQDIVPLLAVLAIILIGNSVTAFLLMRLFRQPVETALTVAASLTQIGEFSFILASFGNAAGLLGHEARDCIIGGAIISILLNPLIFAASERAAQRLKKANIHKISTAAALPASETALAEETIRPEEDAPCAKTGHNIVIGFGAIGEIMAQHLQKAAQPLVIIENAPRLVEKARIAGFETIMGNAVHEDILANANIKQAQNLVLTINNSYEAAHIATLAKHYNTGLHIIARARTEEDKQQFVHSGVQAVATDSKEIAAAMMLLLSAKQHIKTEKTAENGEIQLELLPPAANAAPGLSAEPIL